MMGVQDEEVLAEERSHSMAGKQLRRRRGRNDPQPFTAAIASSVGALAVGAFSLGAGAVGALAVGRLAVKRAAIQQLKIEDLEVGRLRVRDLEVDRERRS
jgi:hypothetical protein